MTDCMRIGGGDFKQGFGGTAWTTGVLFPFVKGADTHGKQTGKFRLGQPHGFADDGGVRLEFSAGGRLGRDQGGCLQSSPLQPAE